VSTRPTLTSRSSRNLIAGIVCGVVALGGGGTGVALALTGHHDKAGTEENAPHYPGAKPGGTKPGPESTATPDATTPDPGTDPTTPDPGTDPTTTDPTTPDDTQMSPEELAQALLDAACTLDTDAIGEPETGDADEDGTEDTVAWDVDGDGTYDLGASDIDGDGELDGAVLSPSGDLANPDASKTC
jgi:hypothetical protein